MKKYLQHIAIVALKYFFDLDYSTFVHSFAMFFVVFGFIKLIGYWLAEEFQGGIETVKYDFATLKVQATQFTERLQSDENDNAVLAYLRNLKNNIQAHKNLSA